MSGTIFFPLVLIILAIALLLGSENALRNIISLNFRVSHRRQWKLIYFLNWCFIGGYAASAGDSLYRGVTANYLASAMFFLGACFVFVATRLSQETLASMSIKLVEQAKLAAVGELSAGIAHELNTPLASIKIKVEQISDLANEKNIDFNLLHETVSEIATCVNSMAVIVGALEQNTVSSLKKAERTAVRMSQIIDDVSIIVLPRMNRHGVDFQIGSVPAGLMVKCAGLEVAQILLDLVSYSYSRIRELEKKAISIEVFRRDKLAVIRVKHSGPPLDEKAISSVFQDYVTVGEHGIVVGLAKSLDLAKRQKGNLSIEKEDLGRPFILSIPLVE